MAGALLFDEKIRQNAALFWSGCRMLNLFLHEVAQNFELLSNIQNKKKPLEVFCPFQGLSNGTKLIKIQSGRTLPLSRAAGTVPRPDQCRYFIIFSMLIT